MILQSLDLESFIVSRQVNQFLQVMASWQNKTIGQFYEKIDTKSFIARLSGVLYTMSTISLSRMSMLYTIFLGKSQTENCQLCRIISGTWPAEGAGAQESETIIAGMLRLINCNIASFSSAVSDSCLTRPGSEPNHQYFCHNIPRHDFFLLSLGCQFILIHDSSLKQTFSPSQTCVYCLRVNSTCQDIANLHEMKSGEKTRADQSSRTLWCQESRKVSVVSQSEASMETRGPIRGQENWTMEGGARGGGGQVSVFVRRVHYVYRWRDLT